jgi:nitroreductase
MNETLKLLRDRKSVRAYADRAISPVDRDLIIDSAIQAPTAGNQVLYTILDIEDTAIKEALAISCDNQPFIAKAPMVLIFLADCRRWPDAYRSAGAEFRKPALGDLVLACEDALIAAQNAVIAAESLGIGSCYIGDILENRHTVVELLHLDEYVFPAAMLVFGYPTEQQKARRKPTRFDKRFIVRKDRYSPLSESELREMFAQAHGDEPGFDYEKWLRAFCARKYMSDFSLEMQRSVWEYIVPAWLPLNEASHAADKP